MRQAGVILADGRLAQKNKKPAGPASGFLNQAML
jgi:hypothetical protein